MTSQIPVVLAPRSPIPLYHQIANQLQHAIETGAVEKGAFLPSEIDLAAQWSVSRPTARRAIQQLVDHGLLVRKRGVGTQVVASRMRRGAKLTSLYDDLAASRRAPTTVVLRCETIPADDDLADVLEIATGTPVIAIERIRHADGHPLAVMRNWLISDVAGTITAERLERSGLYSLLREEGVRPTAARQVIEGRAATEEEASVLEIAPGAPLLVVRREMQDDTGRMIELGVHVYDAARYSVEMFVVDGS